MKFFTATISLAIGLVVGAFVEKYMQVLRAEDTETFKNKTQSGSYEIQVTRKQKIHSAKLHVNGELKAQFVNRY